MWPLAVLALATLTLHLALTPGLGSPADYGLHRDEYLYLVMTRHLAWGYKEIPPLLPALGWLSSLEFGDTALTARVWPALASAATVWVTGQTARAMGGWLWASLTAGVAVALAPIYLIIFNLYQPNCLDVLAWTVYGALLTRWLRRPHPRMLWWLGLAMGIGCLAKVSTVFYAMALLPALVLAGRGRALLSAAAAWAAGVALLVVLPYLAWQHVHNWPLVAHMLGLQGGQLTHVSPVNFLVDQIAMTMPVLPLWLAALIFCCTSAGRRWRLFGWHYGLLIGLLLLTHGKNYYAAGVYPTLIALGTVAWERWTSRRSKSAVEPDAAPDRVPSVMGGAGRVILLLLIPVLAAPVAPALLPLLPMPVLARYVAKLAEVSVFEALVRWEDGKAHAIPQDMADSFGWPEYAPLAARAWARLSPAERQHCLLIGRNYGPAGAATWFGPRYGLPPTLSTNGSFSLWWPEPLPEPLAMIYLDEVDEEAPDVLKWFEQHELVGQIENEYARSRGSQVWLLRDPKPGCGAWIRSRVWQAKVGFDD